MTRMTFEGPLSEKEKAFIQFKKDFGHVYHSQTYHLLEFDRFCISNFPHECSLTEEAVMRWAVIKPTETHNGYVSRICTIRQFGKYLVMMGEKAFVLPDGLRGGDMPLMPFVFTQKSLETFFSFVDSMEYCYRSCVRHLTAPVMFRFMYCCGLRPIEARRMKREDVNLNTGRVFIRESKHSKERIVFAPEELMSLTRDYLRNMTERFPSSDALFVERNGRHYNQSTHQFLFEYCRDRSGLVYSGSKRPNLYSFRHSFATHRIYQWHQEGKDINTLLPALSAYMGHSNYLHTLYYLHFLPELFSEMAGFDFDRFSELLPEVGYDD